MKNTSLLLVLVLLSTLTSIAAAAAPTESCNSTHTLSDKQWQQVSLPCVPKGSGSVADVFGDDIVDAFGASTPSYGTHWVVYKYDLADNGYIKLAETDTLNVGVGYWIIQQSSGDATLDLPANSSPAPAIQSDACPSDAGCFEIPLKTKTGAVGWNMIGRPSHFSSTLGDTRIHADTDACSGGCDLDTANSGELVYNQLWTYGTSNYTLATNPDGTLEPWVSYWVATLQSADGKDPKLLIQKKIIGEPITREQLKTMIINGEDVTQVNTSQITDMSQLFMFAPQTFNQDISRWDVSNVTDMNNMFMGSRFNQDISHWDVSNVTSMASMFFYNDIFNQDISTWDVSKVTNMGTMFVGTPFNQDISRWDVSNVTSMMGMFQEAASFNQDISNWDVSNVTNGYGMSRMFEGALSFNQDLSRWDVSNVINMWRMLSDATSFTNQDLSRWNVSNVTSHDNFFQGAGPGNIEPNWP